MEKTELRQRISTLLEQYKEDLFFGEDLVQLANRLESLESSIVVVGQFSVGKSELLNALLGEKLLSTRRVESTKVTTRIRRCQREDEKQIVLHFKQGGTQSLPVKEFTDLERYTTFQGTSETDGLRMVDLYWPLSFLDQQLMLVDTPGANSLTKEAFAVTEQELKHAAAVLYLFNGQKGLDQTDFSLLTDLMKRRKKVFIVATHIDALTDHQLSEVLNSARGQLVEKIDASTPVDIYPVSSLEALQAKQQGDGKLLKSSKIEDLEHGLTTYMGKQEYLNTELASVQYDLEQLEQAIGIAEEEDAERTAAREKERSLRLERLKLLTKQEYDLVGEYGNELLDMREKRCSQLLDRWKLMIVDHNKIHKAEILKAFKQFKENIVKESYLESTTAATYKQKYLQHNDTVRSIYIEMIDQFEGTVKQLNGKIKEVIEEEDNLFIENLEANKTNITLHWPIFKQKLQKVVIKQRTIDYDDDLFNDYDLEKTGLEDTYKRKKKTLDTVHQKREIGLREYESSLQKLEREHDRAVKDLGSKPKASPITKTKGILFWKKEVTTGYDYSEQERWEENVNDLFRSYETKKLDNRRYYEMNISQAERDEQEIQDDLEQIMFEKDQLEDQLFSEIMKSIDNQKQKAQDYVKKFEKEIHDLWVIQERQALEQFQSHTEQVRHQFFRFVDEALDEALLHTRLEVEEKK